MNVFKKKAIVTVNIVNDVFEIESTNDNYKLSYLKSIIINNNINQ